MGEIDIIRFWCSGNEVGGHEYRQNVHLQPDVYPDLLFLTGEPFIVTLPTRYRELCET